MYEVLQSVYGYQIGWSTPIGREIHKYILDNPTEFDWSGEDYTDDQESYEELFLETYGEAFYDNDLETVGMIGTVKKTLNCWEANTKNLKQLLNQKIKQKDIDQVNEALSNLPNGLQNLIKKELTEPTLEIIPLAI